MRAGHASAGIHDARRSDDVARDGGGARRRTTAHFATADATFVSNQPLIANPLLPQFARPGDRFDLGVSIANQTGAAARSISCCKLTGALAFAQGDPRTQRATEQAATGVQAFRFPGGRRHAGADDVRRRRRDWASQSDAFSVPFAARERAEHRFGDRERRDARRRASIPIALNSGGTLQVTLANSVVPQFVTPSERVMTDDALPLADEPASRLIIASALAETARARIA